MHRYTAFRKGNREIWFSLLTAQMFDDEVRFAQLLIGKVMTYEHVGDVCLKVENSLNIDSGNVISRQHSWLPNNDRCSIKCSFLLS